LQELKAPRHQKKFAAQSRSTKQIPVMSKKARKSRAKSKKAITPDPGRITIPDPGQEVQTAKGARPTAATSTSTKSEK
jgi:hypothetical protein